MRFLTTILTVLAIWTLSPLSAVAHETSRCTFDFRSGADVPRQTDCGHHIAQSDGKLTLDWNHHVSKIMRDGSVAAIVTAEKWTSNGLADTAQLDFSSGRMLDLVEAGWNDMVQAIDVSIPKDTCAKDDSCVLLVLQHSDGSGDSLHIRFTKKP